MSVVLLRDHAAAARSDRRDTAGLRVRGSSHASRRRAARTRLRRNGAPVRRHAIASAATAAPAPAAQFDLRAVHRPSRRCEATTGSGSWCSRSSRRSQMPPAAGEAAAAGGATSGGRVDRRPCATPRRGKQRRRSGRGAGPAPEQRGVQLHDPRSDRRRHPARARVSRRSGQPAGFDNSGESLAMSPALLTKYLQAAREVANHLVLQAARDLRSRRTRCWSRPIATSTASTRSSTSTERQTTDYARLLPGGVAIQAPAALRPARRRRSPTSPPRRGQPEVSRDGLEDARRRRKRTSARSRRCRAMWRAPRRPRRSPAAVAGHADQMRDYRRAGSARRSQLTHTELPIEGPRRRLRSRCLMWRNRQYATHRLKLRPRRRSKTPTATRAIPICRCPRASARGTKRPSPASAPSFPTRSTSPSAAATFPTTPGTRAAT